MGQRLVKVATLQSHTNAVRCCLNLIVMLGRSSDAHFVCRCLRVRFPPTAHWWQQAVMTSHSASPILPRRQRCTLRRVMIMYLPVIIVLVWSDCRVQVFRVAWSPDGQRLVAVTTSGSVVQVTNSSSHSTVYKGDTAVCTIFSLSLSLIPCLVVWMRIQSSWDRCRRWI